MLHYLTMSSIDVAKHTKVNHIFTYFHFLKKLVKEVKEADSDNTWCGHGRHNSAE